MAAEIFRGLNLLFGAAVAGGTAFELVVVLPAARRLPPPGIVQLQRVVSPRSLAHVLSTGPAAAACGIVVLVLDHDFGHGDTVLMVAGLVVTFAAAAATSALYVPLFRLTKDWPEDRADADVLLRWTRAQTVRAPLYGAGLGCFIASAVVS
jgi:hypothetical protein